MTSRGDLNVASSAHEIFVGDVGGTVGGNREFVGQLSPGQNIPPGLRSDTRFGSWAFMDTIPSLDGENSIVGLFLPYVVWRLRLVI